MGRPYPLEFRKRVVAAVERGGLSCNQAAKRFEIGISTAIGWVNRLRKTGSLAPGQMGGHEPKNRPAVEPFPGPLTAYDHGCQSGFRPMSGPIVSGQVMPVMLSCYAAHARKGPLPHTRPCVNVPNPLVKSE
jgi:hypothetical protein